MVLDLQGRVEAVNRRGRALLGSAGDTMIAGCLFAELWAQPDRVRVEEAVGRAACGETPARVTADLATPAGVSLALEIETTPIFDAHGGPERLMAVVRDITHVRGVEKQLRERMTLLETTLAAMDQGVLLIERDGRVGLFNRRALELMDLSGDLMASRPHYRIVRAHRRKRWTMLGDNAAPQWLMSDERRSDDVRSEWHDAGGNALEVRMIPLDDGGVLQTYTDVTHLKLAENASLEANRRLLLAEQIAQMGHWRVELPSRKVRWSDSLRRIRGTDNTWRKATLETAIEVFHADDRAEIARCVVKAIESGDNFEFAARLTRTDGSLRHVIARGMCERALNGEMRALFGTLIDVTELRQAEHAMVESEQRYRLLADNVSDLILLGYADGRRAYVSPAVTPMLGYSVEEARGMAMHDWVHPDDLPEVAGAIAGLSATRRAAAVVYRMRHKDGRWIWGEAAFRRVDDAVEGTMVVTVVRDVTERQKQADELRAAKEVAERAKARADQASQAKSDFLAAMSHEIRTPLNSIIGFTGLLLDAPVSGSEARRYAELIRTSGSALLTIVNDILDFSKIEAGAIELEPKPFSPAALAESCIGIVRGAASAKNLEMRLNLGEGLPSGLIGDEARLRQVLLNLLGNAVKFTHAGSVDLSVQHEGDSSAGERLRFSVADTGIGIPKEKQGRLFQRFSQVEGSIQRDFGGTGLGLAICKRLIKLMAGEIGVASDEGRGATFWFTVTLPHGAVAPVTSARPPAPAHRRGHLLLVEDIAINQELARLVLEAGGHTVDVVDNGAAAVGAVESGAYDLVLMDVQMPDMDGMTATRLIRQLPSSQRRIPIIAMTANVLPEQVRAFEVAGMDDHIGKPFDRTYLYAAIDRWLARAASADLIERCDEPPASALDQATFAGLVELLGREPTAGLLGDLAQELSQRFGSALPSDPPEPRARLRRDAHAVKPAAGMLGFRAFAQLCADLEAPDLTSGEFEARLGRLRNERTAVLAQITSLTSPPKALAAE